MLATAVLSVAETEIFIEVWVISLPDTTRFVGGVVSIGLSGLHEVKNKDIYISNADANNKNFWYLIKFFIPTNVNKFFEFAKICSPKSHKFQKPLIKLVLAFKSNAVENVNWFFATFLSKQRSCDIPACSRHVCKTNHKDYRANAPFSCCSFFLLQR